MALDIKMAQELVGEMRSPGLAPLADGSTEAWLQGGAPVVMLSEQYRMDPAISAFPAAFFYGGRLKDHASVVQRAALRSLPDRPFCRPLAFFDCRQAGGTAGVQHSGCRPRGAARCPARRARQALSLPPLALFACAQGRPMAST